MAGFIVLVDDDPRISNGAESVIGKVLQRVGLNPEDTFLIASGIKYVNIGLPGNIVRGMLSKPERIELDIAESRFPASGLRTGGRIAAGVLDPVR